MARDDAPRANLGILPALIGYHLRRAQVAVFQNFRAAVGEREVTPGQFGVLTIIAHNQGLSQSDLAAVLGVDRSTVVAVIDRFEAGGLVERAPSPRDRRSYALRLTEAGLRLVKDLEDRIRLHEAHIASELDPSERRTLMDLLDRVARAAARP